MTPELFHNLGVWMAIVAACLLLAVAQSLVFVLIGYLGKRIYQRVLRIYHLNVLAYWLPKLEKEGTHIFEKAPKEQL